jgi:23S rRNA (pseudouridine1915-N3)-methyltransferase
MEINLIAIGKGMPEWVNDGFVEYTRRMPADFKVTLTEIPMLKRSRSDAARAIRQESEQMLAAIAKRSYPIALDVVGQQWSTPQLACHLERWHNQGQALSLLIGGPEGLSEPCLKVAKERWSLSRLTFPHPLVRIIVAEQLYRAWSILSHHPYHRN